jgi:4'-phosphopantetheinyl transferase
MTGPDADRSMPARPGPTGSGAAASPPEVCWFDVREVSLSRADLCDLGPAERETARALAFAADRHRYQVAHVLLRRVLSGYTGLAPGQLAFGRERCPGCGRGTGRPVLRGRPGPQFSLSHSGDAVAIAVSAATAVGIDTERDTGVCVCPLTAVMPGPDARRLGPLAEPDRHAAILRWWVRAEAVLKCRGSGIAHGFGGSDHDGFSVRTLTAPAGYHAALAVRR